MTFNITTISHQPALAPLAAAWLQEAFEHPGGRTLEERIALILAPPVGPEETFVLFEDSRPVGTATVAHEDLAARPDLTPWLTGVFVDPAFRRRGYGSALVRRAEEVASTSSVETLWLYTWTAEPLYAQLGWQRVGVEESRGREVVLMMRRLF